MQQFTQEWKATKHNQGFIISFPLFWVNLNHLYLLYDVKVLCFSAKGNIMNVTHAT
jgi:hypothetical protein